MIQLRNRGTFEITYSLEYLSCAIIIKPIIIKIIKMIKKLLKPCQEINLSYSKFNFYDELDKLNHKNVLYKSIANFDGHLSNRYIYLLIFDTYLSTRK